MGGLKFSYIHGVNRLNLGWNRIQVSFKQKRDFCLKFSFHLVKTCLMTMISGTPRIQGPQRCQQAESESWGQIDPDPGVNATNPWSGSLGVSAKHLPRTCCWSLYPQLHSQWGLPFLVPVFKLQGHSLISLHTRLALYPPVNTIGQAEGISLIAMGQVGGYMPTCKANIQAWTRPSWRHG